MKENLNQTINDSIINGAYDLRSSDRGAQASTLIKDTLDVDYMDPTISYKTTGM